MEHKALLIPATEAAETLGIKKTLFYSLVSSGAIGPTPVLLGSKKLYDVQELESWVAHKCPPREQWLSIQEEEQFGEGARR